MPMVAPGQAAMNGFTPQPQPWQGSPIPPLRMNVPPGSGLLTPAPSSHGPSMSSLNLSPPHHMGLQEVFPPAQIASSVYRRGSTESSSDLPMDAPTFAFSNKHIEQSRARAIFALLQLRAENDVEVQGFLQQQHIVETQILENMTQDQMKVSPASPMMHAGVA